MSYQKKAYSNHKKSRASLIVLILLALLLMISAIVLAQSLPDESVWQETSETLIAQPVLDTGFACSAVESQNLYPFGQGVVRLGQNEISYLNIQGTEIYSDSVDMNLPFCIQAGSYFLAADRDGHSYLVLNEQGILFKGSLGGKITGAALRPDGYLALIEDQPDGHGVVRIFQPQTGLKLFDCYFPESGYVISASFAPGQDFFDVALANTDGSSLQPVFKRFSLDGTEIGQLLPDTDDLLPLISYNQDGVMVASGNSELFGLSYEVTEPLFRHSFNQLKSVVRTADALAVIANESFGGDWQLFIIDKNQKMENKLTIGDNVTAVSIFNDRIAIGSGVHIMVYKQTESDWIMNQNLAAEIVRIGFSDENSLTVVTKTGVKKFKIESR
jgi:hypothetical protein